MYNVTPELNKGAGGNFIDVGIHENVELRRLDKDGNDIPAVEYNVSEKGNKFLAFYFVDQKGNVLIKTEWEPTTGDVEKKQTNIMKRVQSIVTTFIPLDEYVMNVTSFEFFGKKTVEILGNKYKGKKVRLKAVYAWNNYVSLPNYTFPGNRFIESMDTPEDKSEVKITSMDKMVRDDKPDTTTGETNSYTTDTQTSTGKTNDLPF